MRVFEPKGNQIAAELLEFRYLTLRVFIDDQEYQSG
jgi:hypothetical protein